MYRASLSSAPKRILFKEGGNPNRTGVDYRSVMVVSIEEFLSLLFLLLARLIGTFTRSVHDDGGIFEYRFLDHIIYVEFP